MDQASSSPYAASGVDSTKAESGLSRLRTWVEKTFDLNASARPLLPLGYFANIIRLDQLSLGIAFTTDGVGTKLLVAEALGKYDTVGIDCIAMNVNDLLCVGATPVSFVDYLAVEEVQPDILDAIGQGLYCGAEQARISIAGGEIAQLREMIRGARPGTGFDLAGAAIGTVPLDRVIIGQDVQPGDALIGLASSGIHSNGLTLARRVLLADSPTDPQLSFGSYLPECGRTVGEELLEPTRIYVPEVTAMLATDAPIKALMHLTGDGFLNLSRVEAEVGFRIETLPAIPPIFAVLQERGKLSDAEMFQVYNMGIGFCVVVAEKDVERIINVAVEHGSQAWRIGTAVASAERTITIEPRGLTSRAGQLMPISEADRHA
jgi:phosphoribosylformylglycinamidine cyclo-ligase